MASPRLIVRILAAHFVAAGLLIRLVHKGYWQAPILFGGLIMISTFLGKKSKAVDLSAPGVPVSGTAPSIIFFDVETTGLPKSRNESYRNVDNWPRAVSIAWIIANDETGVTHSSYEVIKPSGFTIPMDATEIHGINTSDAQATGKELSSVLRSLTDDIIAAKPVQVVAHNIAFDHPILSAEFLRCEIQNPLLELNKYCTMKSTTSLCKLPGNGDDFKWPRLDELVEFLYKRKVEARHNAMEDTVYTLLCYCELSRLRKIGRNVPLREPENLFSS